MIEAFRKTNEDMLNSNFDPTYSGSTAVTVFVYGSLLSCANVGDSRAIIGSLEPSVGNDGSEDHWLVNQISIDHKPEVKGEYDRILQSDGRVDCCRGKFPILTA
jgi:serine/threonine protein phosphatase PrpC